LKMVKVELMIFGDGLMKLEKVGGGGRVGVVIEEEEYGDWVVDLGILKVMMVVRRRKKKEMWMKMVVVVDVVVGVGNSREGGRILGHCRGCHRGVVEPDFGEDGEEEEKEKEKERNKRKRKGLRKERKLTGEGNLMGEEVMGGDGGVNEGSVGSAGEEMGEKKRKRKKKERKK